MQTGHKTKKDKFSQSRTRDFLSFFFLSTKNIIISPKRKCKSL